MSIDKGAITIKALKQKLRVDESFDVVCRTIIINNRNACLFFVDGLVKDEIMEKIIEFFYSVKDDEFLKDARSFSQNCVPYVEVDLVDNIDKAIVNVLSGIVAVAIDDFDSVIMIDARTYPQRDTSEPEKDKVLRGSRDGFVETLVNNTALIRRRIKDPMFTVKVFNVGRVSHTDVAVCYMENKVDKKLLDKIMSKIKNINVEALTMNQQSLIEAIYNYKWYNPFPKIKYSERPDTAAASIIEGGIIVLVDNSPSALILPTSIFDLLEEADDYYFPPFTGTYIRFSRYLITLATLFITPLWILMLQNPQFIPNGMEFIKNLAEPVNVPIIWQLLILEVIIDGTRLASLNTPPTLTTALSIVTAIILGDFSVKSGWFSAESLIYMAFVAMSNYSQPSLELGYTIKFLRIMLLILTSLFNIAGFAIGVILIVIMLLTNRTISEKSYLYPLIPFNANAFIKKVLRTRSIETN